MEAMIEESRIKTLPAVRLTRGERQTIEAEAARLGLSLSDYTRKALSIFATLTTREGLVYDTERRPL